MFRRFLVLAALMFWQGGFVFYASVVVPVGQDELASHTRQGFITRRVTDWLNVSGAVALLPLAWDVAAVPDPSARRRRGRWLTWLGMAALLVALAVLHRHLEGLLDTQAKTLRDAETFRPGHRLYLWLSTVQFACALAYTLLTLWAWRAEDERRVAASREVKEAAVAER